MHHIKKFIDLKIKKKAKIVVDFSYNHNDYLSFLEVNNYLSKINISVPKIL